MVTAQLVRNAVSIALDGDIEWKHTPRVRRASFRNVCTDGNLPLGGIRTTSSLVRERLNNMYHTTVTILLPRSLLLPRAGRGTEKVRATRVERSL